VLLPASVTLQGRSSSDTTAFAFGTTAVAHPPVSLVRLQPLKRKKLGVRCCIRLYPLTTCCDVSEQRLRPPVARLASAAALDRAFVGAGFAPTADDPADRRRFVSVAALDLDRAFVGIGFASGADEPVDRRRFVSVAALDRAFVGIGFASGADEPVDRRRFVSVAALDRAFVGIGFASGADGPVDRRRFAGASVETVEDAAAGLLPPALGPLAVGAGLSVRTGRAPGIVWTLTVSAVLVFSRTCSA